MKLSFALAILALSLSLSAQQDIMQMVYDINSQPERINGYSKLVTQSYIISIEKDAPIDTILYGKEGRRKELTLYKEVIDIFGEKTDRRYEVDMLTGDTATIITTTYNEADKITNQTTEYGNSAATSLYNNEQKFTYDSTNRVTSIIKTSGSEIFNKHIFISYHKDGLLDSLKVEMGMYRRKVTRKNLDGYIEYNLISEVSNPIVDNIESNIVSSKPYPIIYWQTIKKNDLYETKLLKEEEKNIGSTLHSSITRDIKGHIQEEINYQNNEITLHKTYTYIEGKLMSINNLLEDFKLINEYDSIGNLIVAYDNYTVSNMTYNKDGMLTTKSTTGLFYNEFVGLDVLKYYK